MEIIKANKDKQLIIEVDNVKYMRIPVKTHVVMPDDKLEDVLDKYVADKLIKGDIIFVAESIVASMQKRSIKLVDIKPRKLATILSKFVYKNPYGIGLSMPETMEMALREVGTPRIILASAGSAVGKLFKQRGWFYKIAGPLAREIDGPTPYTLPPYNEYVVLGPKDPQDVADRAQAHIKNDVMIVDINDLGGNILGNSSKTFSDELAVKVLKDNPLGQSHEQTPIGIIRQVTSE